MEQRPLRLGDIVDDYCPRERRVTNHAIVAMLDTGIQQTRCTTCDSEHAYKGGTAPRRRTRAAAAASPVTPVLAPTPRPEAAITEPDPEPVAALAATDASAPADDAGTADPAFANQADEGPVHRRLIRATLPRVEGQKEARQIPEFTVRQPLSRAGNFRDGGGHQRGDNRGNRADSSHAQRFGARQGQPGRGGQPRGQQSGFRSGQQPQRRSGRKRH